MHTGMHTGITSRPGWSKAPSRLRVLVRAVLAVVAALLFAAFTVLTAPGAWAAGSDGEPTQPELILFWGDGCPHCAAEKEWLPQVAAAHPELRITMYEVWYDTANQERLAEAAARLGFDAGAVPVTIVGDQYWIGWSETLRPEIEAAIKAEVAAAVPTPGAAAPAAGEVAAKSVDVPLVGAVDVGSTSLVASTLVIGFVDGINPCSLWVISVLLAIVVRTGSRGRVMAIGGTFLLVTAVMYAIFIAGIYSALNVVGHLGAIQVVVALVAGLFGVVSIKDYFAFKQGISFTIPDSSKPGIFKRMRQAAGQQALLPALGATGVLAVAVSLLETPCTAGFPVLWTGLLEANGVSTAQAAGLFVLYLVPFLVDELVVFGLAVVTLRSTKLQEKHGRLLKLVAGTMMIALAVTVLISPQAMSSPSTALAVFAMAFAAAGLTHLAMRTVRGKDWAGSRS